jgi:prolyl 4-hydroxylase
MKTNFVFFLIAGIASLFIYVAYATIQHNFTASQEKELEMEVLSWSPRIFVFHNFLSDEECEYVKSAAAPSMSRSTVVDYKSDKGLVDIVRTSQGMFFPLDHQDAILTNIENRISKLTLIPLENGESIQVLHYDKGAEYKPHYDYFDPRTVGGLAHYNRGGQRVASFLMYLNTPEEGGETIFPRVNIKVKPQKGDALLFYSCGLDGHVDPKTFHGGAPVIKGEKWLATRWLRQHTFK